MTGFHEVGVSYCLLHHGLVHDGQTDCDFRWRSSLPVIGPALHELPCVLRPLGYQQGDQQ